MSPPETSRPRSGFTALHSVGTLTDCPGVHKPKSFKELVGRIMDSVSNSSQLGCSVRRIASDSRGFVVSEENARASTLRGESRYPGTRRVGSLLWTHRCFKNSVQQPKSYGLIIFHARRRTGETHRGLTGSKCRCQCASIWSCFC